MFRRVLFALAAVACLVGTPGCRSKSTTYKYKIAVVPKGLTHEFWQSIERGARRAAADLAEKGVSVEILWDGPKRESEVAEQISIVRQMVDARGISGLVLA